MAYYNYLSFLIVLVFFVNAEAQLVENFYSSTCPNVETIARQAFQTKATLEFTAIPATIRLLFHDCFVQGCDASIMIKSPNNDAERDAPENLSLRATGFDTIVKVKEAVEAQCPGVVSCADILVMAARDAVGLAGGPAYNVELGRRDALDSNMSRVPGELPDPNFNLTQLNSMFAGWNLSQKDMIALSGVHTIGFSHCNQFRGRIFSNPIDPTINSSYAMQLRQACSQETDPNVVFVMDPVSPAVFDNVYYQNLIEGKGMFTSDQVLFTDPSSRQTVIDFANNPDEFSAAFVEAVTKLGRAGVKTGNEGEIRMDCTRINS